MYIENTHDLMICVSTEWMSAMLRVCVADARQLPRPILPKAATFSRSDDHQHQRPHRVTT
jgi:hypothetical protein